jgi:O-antigen ligase
VLVAEVKAPLDEGRYLLVWDMVHEHTTWFSEQGVRAALVPARVAAAGAVPPPAASSPIPFDRSFTWRPSRDELWRLAAGMWAERPFTGFGSDSFRWTYGARAGRRDADVRVFANNDLFEAAATTGTLGALALVLTLGAAGFAAARSATAAFEGSDLAAASVALLGLVVGLTAHGAVDYLLAFTGHYLLFGLVVGSCAALSAEAR